jgi:Flp pilus assembly protein TadG
MSIQEQLHTRCDKPALPARLLLDRRGVAALEFVIIAPMLLLLLFGMCLFGIAVDDYFQLTAAAQAGAQTLALTRGATDPYSTTVAAIEAAAGTLTAASIGTTMTVGGASCGSSSCSVSSPGQIAQVTLTYPCDLTLMGFDFGGTTCTLTSVSAAAVQ